MSEMMTGLNSLADKWWLWMAHGFWQSALLAAVVVGLVWAFRRQWSSQFRHALLLIALLKFAMPPFVASPIGAFSNAAPPMTVVESFQDEAYVPTSTELLADGIASGDFDHAMTNTARVEEFRMLEEALAPPPLPAWQMLGWKGWMGVAYLVGCVIVFAGLVRRQVLLRRQLADAKETDSNALVALFDELRKEAGVGERVRLIESDRVDSPFAIGVRKSAVVIPTGLDSTLSDDQMRIVLAHELAHVRRHDVAVGWLQSLLSVVWWFNPMFWILGRALRAHREDCCDDWVIVRRLAKPERYCETLLDAARHFSQPVAEPVAIGFAAKSHPIARRMRRLMDGSLFRSAGLGRISIVVIAMLALVVLPGAGRKSGTAPVVETDLQGPFGWRNLDFVLSEPVETALKQAAKIAQGRNSTSNGVTKFERDQTRLDLEELLAKHPTLFYAQHLLATWHRDYGDTTKSKELFASALSNAPTVLVERYLQPGGKPMKNIEIGGMTIEHNRVQKRSLDPSLKLRFIDLQPDGNGDIRLPVYQTVYRVNSRSYPRGHEMETRSLGWFEAESKEGRLPDVVIWKKYEFPTGHVRTAEQSEELRNAKGASGRRLKVDGVDLGLAWTARVNGKGSYGIENGEGGELAGKSRLLLPVFKNHTYMDHAILKLDLPQPERVEIEEISLLESRSKLRLDEFQRGSMVKLSGDHRIHVSGLRQALPREMDVALKVRLLPAGAYRHRLEPKAGSKALINGMTVAVSAFHRGHYPSWSSRNGFEGEAANPELVSEVLFQATGPVAGKVSMYVVLKNGRRWNLKESGWISSRSGSELMRLPTPLEEVSHFELRPYADRQTVYFENVRLPAMDRELQEMPAVVVKLYPGQTNYLSEVLAPFSMKLSARQGRAFGGVSGNDRGFTFTAQRSDARRNPRVATLAVELENGVDFSKKTYLLHTDGSVLDDSTGGSRFSNPRGPAGWYRNIEANLKQAKAMVVEFN